MTALEVKWRADAWRVEYDRSVVHEFSGDRERAASALERARELQPDLDRLVDR
ncbi:MAG: hypothetical protein ACYSWX_02050 [Planctomycetota bacterium]